MIRTASVATHFGQTATSIIKAQFYPRHALSILYLLGSIAYFANQNILLYTTSLKAETKYWHTVFQDIIIAWVISRFWSYLCYFTYIFIWLVWQQKIILLCSTGKNIIQHIHILPCLSIWEIDDTSFSNFVLLGCWNGGMAEKIQMTWRLNRQDCPWEITFLCCTVFTNVCLSYTVP